MTPDRILRQANANIPSEKEQGCWQTEDKVELKLGSGFYIQFLIVDDNDDHDHDDEFFVVYITKTNLKEDN